MVATEAEIRAVAGAFLEAEVPAEVFRMPGPDTSLAVHPRDLNPPWISQKTALANEFFLFYSTFNSLKLNCCFFHAPKTFESVFHRSST
jgi:hypothetical protein